MKRTREQIKEEMMKKYEQELDKILDWQEKAEKPNLTEFENRILASRKRLSEETIKALLEGEPEQEPERAPKCAKCGKEMADRGKRPQVIETRVGTLRIERVYYYCETCKEGFFPPGSTTPGEG